MRVCPIDILEGRSQAPTCRNVVAVVEKIKRLNVAFYVKVQPIQSVFCFDRKRRAGIKCREIAGRKAAEILLVKTLEIRKEEHSVLDNRAAKTISGLIAIEYRFGRREIRPRVKLLRLFEIKPAAGELIAA